MHRACVVPIRYHMESYEDSLSQFVLKASITLDEKINAVPAFTVTATQILQQVLPDS
ncbi:MAG TPA: hypothetical protein VLC28_11145 [Flavitalea sp.]|nr:hypothetical protein [Flavitalea sp.]